MFLTNLSLKRPIFATVTILALVALGLISYFSLNVNDYPDVEFPFVAVTIVQPGASPEQVETKIAYKLEEAIGQISGVKHIYTHVREGVCVTFAEFTLETEPEVAAQEVRDKIGAIRRELPQDIDEPVISKFEPHAVPIISLAVTGDMSIRELTTVADDLIKSRLEVISGVGSIQVNGAEEREIQIKLDKNKLAAYSLSTYEVLESLRMENMEVPGGKVGSGDREITLRTVGSLKNAQDFANLPVARREGVQLYVKDVAVVADGIKERESMTRYQGRPAIGLDIVKQSGANTVEVADQIKKVYEQLQKELPPGVKLEIVRDNSIYIQDALRDVVRTLAEGSLLAVLMVFIFLKDWRSTLISAIAIPTSIIATFFFMDIMGFTLNFLSLMALSLSIGLLIDDAIVVIENIVRHLRMGKDPLAAAREATSEIGLAVTATTLTVVAVFLPVGMMTGMVGQFFKQFGLTVVFAILVSLLISFTLVPLLSSRQLSSEERAPGGPLGKFLLWFNRGFDNITLKYVSLLKVVLRRRLITMGLAMLLFFGSLGLIPMLGSTFIPSSDMSELSVVAELDAGLSLGASARVTGKLEEIINTHPEVIRVYSTIQNDRVNIFVKTLNKNQRERTIDQIASELRLQLAEVPGVRATVNMQAGMNVEKTVQFRILGENYDMLQEYAEQAQRIMEQTPGAVDVGSSYKTGKPEGTILVRHDLAADLGISTAQIADTLRTMFNGVVVGQFEDGENRFDVRVRLDEDHRTGLHDLNNIYLSSRNEDPSGRRPMIELNQVTTTVFDTAPSEIRRFDRTKEIVVSANLEGVSLGEFNKAFSDRANKEIQFQPGYWIHAGGDAEMMEDTFKTMIIAMITGILFIFFILAAQFESYIDPFSIMLSIPMAIVGAIFALLILGSELSLFSMIGMIMLMGLVTKNAILLIDFAKQQRARGVERNEALLNAALIRLRPIIMTSLAMIFAMMPLALGLGEGAEGRAPMAHAIIGGLITSTLLTLVVVPVIYSLLDDLRAKTSKLLRRKQRDGSLASLGKQGDGSVASLVEK